MNNKKVKIVIMVICIILMIIVIIQLLNIIKYKGDIKKSGKGIIIQTHNAPNDKIINESIEGKNIINTIPNEEISNVLPTNNIINNR